MIWRKKASLETNCWDDIDDPVQRHSCYVGASIIGALGSIGGSLLGGSQAAKAQTDAAASATRAEMNMYQQNRRLLAPYYKAGDSTLPMLKNFIDPNNANGPLAALLRLTTPGPNQNAALMQTPGYQFTQTMGQKAIDNSLAARGLAGPGGALSRASADYGTGLAQSTWQNEVNALLSSFQAGATPLQNLVSTGAGAASALAGAGTQTGAQIGQNLIGAGNAQAAMWNSLGGAMGSSANNIGNSLMLNKLLGLYANA